MKLKDFYTVSLWNYCSGTKDPKTGDLKFDYCGKPTASYWFNPLEVWGLNETDGAGSAGKFPKEVKKAMKTYQTVAKWMFTAYVCAFIATCVEFVLGFFAIFSRWGSFVTTIASCVSSELDLSSHHHQDEKQRAKI
jgi:hypothetical protein